MSEKIIKEFIDNYNNFKNSGKITLAQLLFSIKNFETISVNIEIIIKIINNKNFGDYNQYNIIDYLNAIYNEQIYDLFINKYKDYTIFYWIINIEFYKIFNLYRIYVLKANLLISDNSLNQIIIKDFERTINSHITMSIANIKKTLYHLLKNNQVKEFKKCSNSFKKLLKIDDFSKMTYYRIFDDLIINDNKFLDKNNPENKDNKDKHEEIKEGKEQIDKEQNKIHNKEQNKVHDKEEDEDEFYYEDEDEYEYISEEDSENSGEDSEDSEDSEEYEYDFEQDMTDEEVKAKLEMVLDNLNDLSADNEKYKLLEPVKNLVGEALDKANTNIELKKNNNMQTEDLILKTLQELEIKIEDYMHSLENDKSITKKTKLKNKSKNKIKIEPKTELQIKSISNEKPEPILKEDIEPILKENIEPNLEKTTKSKKRNEQKTELKTKSNSKHILEPDLKQKTKTKVKQTNNKSKKISENKI